jgi:leucine-rich repeat-containing protein 49
MPIIENEPNLRLLSLQHNFISKFCIPDNEFANNNGIGNEKDPKNKRSIEKSVDAIDKFNSQANQYKQTQQDQQLQQPVAANPSNSTSLAPKPFLRQKSTSRNQINLNFNSITNTSFLQSLQTKNHLLKKSNSLMITNYTPLTPPLTPTQASSSFLANFTLRNKLVTTPSFNILEEQPDETSIIVSNNIKSKTEAITNLDPDVSIDHMLKYNFKNLVFLDLYNNQIEKIENLEGLKSLTVLLLGKNRISDIAGIICLKATLPVLDLHGNKICNISHKICHLHELKSLNLAGNLLRQIQPNDFAGLLCLKELNLKRNRIKKVCGFDDLHNLERLWLCHNDLQSIEDMQAVAKSINLKEITIENNPISLGGDCISFLVSYLPSLMSLNQLQITEQVRRAANAWRKSKENTDQNFQYLSTDLSNSKRREEIISNARTNWELIRSQQSNLVNASHRKDLKSVVKRPFTFIPDTSNQTKHSSSSISSTASSNNQSEKSTKASRSKNLQICTKENATKLKQSSSNENENFSEEDNEYFHLPPILSPYLEPDMNFSSSSIKPNVDSVSSNCSSDNDVYENMNVRSKSTIPTTPPIINAVSQPPSPFEIIEDKDEICCTPPLPVITTESLIEICLEENFENGDSISEKSIQIFENLNENSLQLIQNDIIYEQSMTKLLEDSRKSNLENDKLSMASKNSGKTSSDSINTISSQVNDEHSIQLNNKTAFHQITITKNRSANQSKKITPTLTRAQTARTFSVTHQSNILIKAKDLKKDVEKDQGADYLVEICGRYLNIYGVGALKFVDKQWNVQKANDVHTAKFSYINFNNICSILGKVKSRFPNIENFLFRETNITCYGQLNALADTQGIKSLIIESEGNPIIAKEWRSFAIYRLNHWGLKQINGLEITDQEIQDAEITYSGLADLILWSLPDSLLQPLFSRLHVEEKIQSNKITPKEWLMQYAEESIRHIVGKEALQWKKISGNQDETAIRRRGKAYFSSMIENTCNAVEKLQKLEYLWPTLLAEMIRNTLIDYSQIDVYVRNVMNDVLKEI